MNVLTKNAQLLFGRSRILQFQGILNLVNILSHGPGHSLLVFAVAGMNMQDGNAPGVFFLSVKRDVVIVPRQAFTLGSKAEVVGDPLADFFPELAPKSRGPKSMP